MTDTDSLDDGPPKADNPTRESSYHENPNDVKGVGAVGPDHAPEAESGEPRSAGERGGGAWASETLLALAEARKRLIARHPYLGTHEIDRELDRILDRVIRIFGEGRKPKRRKARKASKRKRKARGPLTPTSIFFAAVEWIPADIARRRGYDERRARGLDAERGEPESPSRGLDRVCLDRIRRELGVLASTAGTEVRTVAEILLTQLTANIDRTEEELVEEILARLGKTDPRTARKYLEETRRLLRARLERRPAPRSTRGR